MEKKNIVIIVIIVIVVNGIGVGFGVYYGIRLFKQRSGDEDGEDEWQAPGAPEGIPQNRILKFGILDDMGYITGQGARNGAWLAAYEINERGGVQVGDETYYIGIETEDTEEANPAIDLAKGVSAAKWLINNKTAEYLLGGFRTEVLQAYREVVMDAEKLFFITGSAAAGFCQDVYDNYERYKYTFRIQPLNEIFLGEEVIRCVGATIYDLHSRGIKDITKIAILREDLFWTANMEVIIQALIHTISMAIYGDPPGGPYTLNIVKSIAYPIDAGPNAFYDYWSEIEASGAEITIPIISGPSGLYYSNVYGDTEQSSLSLGINVMGQQNIFWEQTGGNCEYEIETTSFIRHAKTPYTIPFWDHYVGNFSTAPIYTATGAYDAINTMVYAMWAAQSINTEDIIAELENSEWQGDESDWTIPTGTPRTEYLYDLGSPTILSGFLTDETYQRYMTRHDTVEGSDPLGHAVFVQWMDDGLGHGYWECIPCGPIPGIGSVDPSLASWEVPLYTDQPWGQVITANITLPVR